MTSRHEYIVTPITSVGANSWTPDVGEEMLEFLKRVVPGESAETVRESTISILAQGICPSRQASQATGLVVGYVQSGKTMSFEAVTALARDNGFQLVIVIAGSSNPLLEQSTRRLRHDLGLDISNRIRRWVHLPNPSADESTLHQLRNVLAEWRDPHAPKKYKRTVLITVLKQHKRLQDLVQVLSALEMQQTPVLVIDDEADQASLNNKVKRADASTTYNRLMSLRQVLPCHTYLQYTATPQAPLLINIIDSLSPDFVHVLKPGSSYIGGDTFFSDNRYLRSIPVNEVPRDEDSLSEPPESLLTALRIFMVGVAIGLESADDGGGNRSMLVHPSHRTSLHQTYARWVLQIFEHWKSVLSLADESDPDRVELIEDFRHAYDDLGMTLKCPPSFDTVASSLRFAFRQTQVLEINTRSGKTPQVDWSSSYGSILVGGQAMDRGFTIEGLTVTYMPRGVGVGNADTVQQRGRFFGYKKGYIDYCRIYLDDDTRSAFEDYVQHEEFMRNQLIEFQGSGYPLNEWKRLFVLDQALRPCRSNVLSLGYIRERFSDTWVVPDVGGEPSPVVVWNRQIVKAFLSEIDMIEDSGNAARTATQRHRVCRGLPLMQVLGQLLLQFRVAETQDSHRNTMLLLHLSQMLEANPDEVCSVFLMSNGSERERGVDRMGKIKQLFQGEFPVKPKSRRGLIYGGDRSVHEEGDLTIQIHNLRLTRTSGEITPNVPVIAVWVPKRIGLDWFYQRSPE